MERREERRTSGTECSGVYHADSMENDSIDHESTDLYLLVDQNGHQSRAWLCEGCREDEEGESRVVAIEGQRRTDNPRWPDYVYNGAYFLPDGTEVLYRGDLYRDGRDLVSFPREFGREMEALAGRPLTPRMVECDEGHKYHLQVERFPIVYPCPECAKDLDLEHWFRGRNWSLDHTGGGCTAWTFTDDREEGGEWYVMVTDDASAPRESGDLWEPCVGLYAIDAEGEYLNDEGEWFWTQERDAEAMLALAAMDLPDGLREWITDATKVLTAFPPSDPIWED